MQAQQHFNAALVKRLQQFALFMAQAFAVIDVLGQFTRDLGGGLIIKLGICLAEVLNKALQELALFLRGQICEFVFQHDSAFLRLSANQRRFPKLNLVSLPQESMGVGDFFVKAL